MKEIDHAAPRRNTKAARHCAIGLTVPRVSEPALDLSRLTAGGAEIYRRIRRPVPTCNALAALAGIGGTMEAR